MVGVIKLGWGGNVRHEFSEFNVILLYSQFSIMYIESCLQKSPKTPSSFPWQMKKVKYWNFVIWMFLILYGLMSFLLI